jgi:23S rRNA (cytosine1962-C5)-methyltransferase
MDARVKLSGRGRRRLEGGHPWIFADDVVATEAEPGDVVAIHAPDQRVLGFGLYSSESKIRVRLVTRADERPGDAFFEARLARAVAARRRMGLFAPEGACRLLAGDAEGVPGLVIDHYAGVFVLQSGTQGSDRLVPLFLRALHAQCGAPRAVVERSDSGVRRLEGLEKRVQVLDGAVPEELVVNDGGLAYEVDVLHGHKTGHYLDQRDNRARAARRVRGGSMLDAFAYDGLFGVRAALEGARRVLCLDQSEPALERARRNAERNGVADRVAVEKSDVMRDLRARAESPQRFEVVVVDPPAFARNKAELPGAERGYRELNARALRLVEGGGTLVSASCSHAMRPEHFVRLLAEAAHLAGRAVYLDELCGAAPDHAALLALPESSYLKCAFVRVEDQ